MTARPHTTAADHHILAPQPVNRFGELPAFARRPSRPVPPPRRGRSRSAAGARRIPAGRDPWAGWEHALDAAPTPAPRPAPPPAAPADGRLALLALLPEAWRRKVLQACGGTGDEAADALAWALAPRPECPEAIRTLNSIIGRTGRLSLAAVQYVDVLVDAIADHHTAVATWDAARPLAPLAEAVAERASRLRHVDPGALRLLDADDDGLTVEAQRLVDVATARYRLVACRAAGAGERADADAGDTTARDAVHPRDRDVPSQRRRLRRRVGRADAHAAGVLGLVGGRPALGLPDYATDWSLGRWRAAQLRTTTYLTQHQAVAPDGRAVPLAEIAEKNKNAAAASWYAMVLGMGEHAKRCGHVPVFVSATLPPRWHLHPRYGNAAHGDPALSPTAAARELQRRWHASLCLARSRGVRPYGVRVVEPHSDGCPHLHALLWLPVDDEVVLADSLQHHYPADGGTAEAALTVRRIDGAPVDPDKKRAAPMTYIMHYVMQITSPGQDAESQRVQAWASHVGIRRLSLVGVRQGTIGLWRAAHRSLRDNTAPAEPGARAVRRAMRKGQWATALALLGAWADEPRYVPVRESRRDRWGDVVRETTGWTNARTGRLALVRRPVRWTIQKANLLERNGLSVVASDPSDPRGVVTAGADPPGDPDGILPPTPDVGGTLCSAPHAPAP